jgi:hypothetical protein
VYDPTPAALEGLQPDVKEAAIFLVNAYRAAGYPAIITSGRRTAAHNVAVGGAPLSRHIAGRAIDLGFLGISPAPLDWLRPGGLLWESMGGRWGGRFQSPDPIHFDG